MVRIIVKLLDSKGWKEGLCIFTAMFCLFGSLIGAYILLWFSIVASIILMTLYCIYILNREKVK